MEILFCSVCNFKTVHHSCPRCGTLLKSEEHKKRTDETTATECDLG
jgi:hypothetical protein